MFLDGLRQIRPVGVAVLVVPACAVVQISATVGPILISSRATFLTTMDVTFDGPTKQVVAISVPFGEPLVSCSHLQYLSALFPRYRQIYDSYRWQVMAIFDR